MQIPLSPIRFLERSAKYFPTRPALICSDISYNYQQFIERVNQASNLFDSITKGRVDEHPPRIVFITWNCHRVIEACYAALRARFIRVPLNARLSPTEWAFLINDVRATSVVLDSELVDQFESIRPELKTVENILVINHKESSNLNNYDDYDDALSKQHPNWNSNGHLPRLENEIVEIFYTSGTTGKPKGVTLTPRNLYLNATTLFLPLSLQPTDIFLHSLALFHINGWGALHFMTACGGKQIVMRKFRPDKFCELVEKNKVTLTCLVPTMLNMLVNFPDLKKYDLSSLRLIISGGAKLPIAVGKEVIEKLDCDIIGSYGLTETSPVVTISEMISVKEEGGKKIDDVFFRRKFCPGIESLDCELKVINEDGEEVEWNDRQIGEILVRGNVVTDGYWCGSEDAEEAFTSEQQPWLRTGDLAVLDKKGYVHIVDRKKDIIVSGGENISSLEIEDVLRMHPSVMEAAVIPSPSEKWGEEPLAVLVLKPNEKKDEQSIFEFCKGKLASFKLPRKFKFVEELPKSGTGKILKRELKKRYL